MSQTSGERSASIIDREALTVGMAVVPGLYSRNKMFLLFTDPDVRLARSRSATLRGVVRQLSGASGTPSRVEIVRGGGSGRTCVLRYRIPSMKLDRRLELSETEIACVVYLAGRAGHASLHASERDRALIDAALARLSLGLRLRGLEE
ncbi:hypothetical protein [Pendulispora albinea]|uniref:Uncharacterized protein n=1 Tax=Pendulispora albinea TaxID=2741071 RepID=A0ABZ2M8D3_9BACT